MAASPPPGGTTKLRFYRLLCLELEPQDANLRGFELRLRGGRREAAFFFYAAVV